MPIGYSNKTGLPLKPPISKKGKYQPNATKETRKKMSRIAKEKGFGKWMKGKKLSEEHIKNRTIAQSGEKHYKFDGKITPHKKLKTLEILAGRKKPKKCELCNRERDICFDHDHKTEKFRGWICRQCNTALGMVNDDIALLKKMIKYLIK